jgi:branched-chain amino acid transport system substrate-binding protein
VSAQRASLALHFPAGAASLRPRGRLLRHRVAYLFCWAACLVVLLPQAGRADALVTVAIPSDGPAAASGREIAAGATLAVEELNARGGVAGERIVLRTRDDGCFAGAAEAAAKDIAATQPALVIGHPCAGGAIAAARVYAASHLLFMATETRHPLLTDKRAGPTIFRLAGRDDAEGADAARHFMRHFAGRRIALVSDRTALARDLVERTRAALVAAGNNDVTILTIVSGEKDYGSLVARVRDWGCAAVMVAGFPLEAASILRQLRAAGLTAAFLGATAIGTSEFTSAAGHAADAAEVLVPSDPTRWSTAAPTVERLKAGGREPTPTLLRGYAAVVTWAEAAARAGTVAPEAVARALAEAPLPSPLGPLAFEAKGDAKLPSFDVLAWRGERWVYTSP